MLFPTNFSVPRTSRSVIDVFGGYNANTVIGENEFSTAINMSADSYPALATRKPHGRYLDFLDEEQRAKRYIVGAVATHDKLTYVYIDANNRLHIVLDEDNDIILGYSNIGLEARQIVVMGAYFVVLPDKLYINSTNLVENGKIEVTNTTTSLSVYLSDDKGVRPSVDYTSDQEPDKKDEWKDYVFYDGDVWLNTKNNKLYEYSANTKLWNAIEYKYTTLEAAEGDDISAGFDVGDLIKITEIAGTLKTENGEINLDKLNGEYKVINLNGNKITIEYSIESYEMVEAETKSDKPFTFSRTMPVMDFVFEHENRLWGCRYGENNDGEFVNKIYASALGNFKRWSVYDGVSTDSFTASVGTKGAFTAGISYLGRPYFFKEDSIHTIYGKYPVQYQLDVTGGRGVLKGAECSLALVNELLYYRSRHEICVFDGTLPVSVSDSLGTLPMPMPHLSEPTYGTACGFKDKYIIGLTYRNDDNGNGVEGLLTYDTRTRLWHTEEPISLGKLRLIEGQKDVYMLLPGNGFIDSLYGEGKPKTAKIQWKLETGDIFLGTPDNKYITRITIRLYAEDDVRIGVKYTRGSYNEEVRHESTIKCRKSLHSFSLPIKGIRTDSFRIRIEGEGKACIYSIAKTIEDGSEINFYEVNSNETI